MSIFNSSSVMACWLLVSLQYPSGKQTDRRERQQKDVSSYNWKSLVEDGKLASLGVPELDKYLEHYKHDKIRRIIAHYFNKNGEQIHENFAINRDDDSESGSDDDLLIYERESSDSVTSSSEDSVMDIICNPPSLVSRSGHKVGHWQTVMHNTINILRSMFNIFQV